MRDFERAEKKTKEDMTICYTKLARSISDTLKSRLSEYDIYDATIKRKNVVGLLDILEHFCITYKVHQEPVLSLYQAINDFHMIRQGKNESNHSYYKRFKTIVRILEKNKSDIGNYQ